MLQRAQLPDDVTVTCQFELGGSNPSTSDRRASHSP
jgi:hypothetical protein